MTLLRNVPGETSPPGIQSELDGREFTPIRRYQVLQMTYEGSYNFMLFYISKSPEDAALWRILEFHQHDQADAPGNIH